MTPEAQLALINNIVPIITALVSLVGAIAAVFSWQKAKDNSKAISANDVKTDEVGKAVNGRMSAFIEEMKAQSSQILTAAIGQAKAEAEKAALTHFTEFKTQIALAKSERDIQEAVAAVEKKLVRDPNVDRRTQPGG